MRMAAVGMLVAVSACAPKAPPVLAGGPKHPDFIFPAAPEGTAAAQVARLDRGWQYLQADDFRNAEREFAAALKQQPSFHPAETAMGWTEMARSNEKDALARFDRALQSDASYVPALIGRGRTLLELDRDADALASLEAALAKDPSLTDVKSRIDVLKFRATQDMLGRAKAAADARRYDEAAAIYRQAIAASPDSGFLYRDLAAVEQRAGQQASALEHYRRALELDSNDARSHAGIGAILDSQGDVLGAIAAYEKARAIDAGEVPESVMVRLRAAAALAKQPPEYRAIPEHATITRADLAALIAVRLDALLAQAKPRQVIITDIRGNWAQNWIAPVVRAGVMDTLPNYEFEPNRQVRRAELATTVSRLLALIGALKPQLAAKWQAARLNINDVGSTHLSYPAVSAAVASGVMSLANGNFDLLRSVSGPEILDIIGRLEALAR
jgi:tetratricopeptide (TPR) repeat protein